MFGDWLQLQLLQAGVESVPLMVVFGVNALGFGIAWAKTKERIFRDYFVIFALASALVSVEFWIATTYYGG